MVHEDTQNMGNVTNDLGPVGIPKNTDGKPQISVTRDPFLENPGKISGPKSLVKSKSQEKKRRSLLTDQTEGF